MLLGLWKGMNTMAEGIEKESFSPCVARKREGERDRQSDTAGIKYLRYMPQ
jgi:hypothetical protein